MPVVQPFQQGRTLILCVGYKATLDELQPILSYVTKLAGPKGGRKSPYKDAWVDNISHVAARK